jgi:WYL domain
MVAHMDPEETVRAAIEARRALFLVYRGGGTRVVQPHALYRARGGRVFLDGYQVAGESASGMLPGWREFDLAQTSDVEPLAERFEIAPGFDAGALRYRGGVLAMVSAGRRAAR